MTVCPSLLCRVHAQGAEPTYPTVVPASDFNPDKDAARIETAIKTKGKRLFSDPSVTRTLTAPPECTDEAGTSKGMGRGPLQVHLSPKQKAPVYCLLPSD